MISPVQNTRVPTSSDPHAVEELDVIVRGVPEGGRHELVNISSLECQQCGREGPVKFGCALKPGVAI